MTQFSADDQLPQDPSRVGVRRVVIVGGGSSGWMAAAYLATSLARHVDITLVESEAIGTVGVGEATIPPILKFNRFLGIDERMFLAATQGTYKLGIEFHGWGAPGDRYLHQFGAAGREIDALVRLHHWWQTGRLAARLDGLPYPAWQELHVAWHAAMADRFAPAGPGQSDLRNRYAHAYHFDAGLYAALLRQVAQGRGVTRIEGRITGVARNGESGRVEAVVLEDGSRREGDLFVDCSGFSSLLLGSELAEPWDDWSALIPSDRALAVPSARAPGGLKPYTQGIAHPVGWQWRIPLQHRTGNGHVFASAFCSEDEAERRLMATLETPALGDARLIRFRTGRYRRAWVHNVVGIGLASGFLEPLESTSLHFVQSALERLVELFPTGDMDPVLQEQFNRRIEHEWLDVRDFIVAHYHLNQRQDSEFWRYTANMAVPDSLAHLLELWRTRGILGVDGGHLFQLGSWASMFIGQRFLPAGVHALADRADPAFAARQVRQIARDCAAAADGLPLHADFIARHCAAAETVAP